MVLMPPSKLGVDLDGSPIPEAMLALYNQVMGLESQRARSGCLLYTSDAADE